MTIDSLLLFAAEGGDTATQKIFFVVKFFLYTLKALVGLYGIYCVVWMFQTFRRRSFATKGAQREFTEQVCSYIDQGAYDQAEQMCSAPKNWYRAVPILARYAIQNRHMTASRLKQLIALRMETEVMTGVDNSIATVNTCIKTAPMLGLFGTVIAMIGAFSKIAGQSSPDATKLGTDIALALNATALGLFVAITLLLTVNFAIVRRRSVEDVAVTNIEEILSHLEDAQASHNGAAARYARTPAANSR